MIPAPRPTCGLDWVFSTADGSLFVQVDDYGDNRKTEHFAVLRDGRERSVDWTPYAAMTADDFRRWVRLGTPRRVDNGPLDSERLKAMEKEQAA